MTASSTLGWLGAFAMALGVVAGLSFECRGEVAAPRLRSDVKSESPRGCIGTPIGTPIDLEGDPRLKGIAFDDAGRTLYVLDDIENDADGAASRAERIVVYTYDPERAALKRDSSFDVPAASNTGRLLADGRGLAFSQIGDRRVLYTLSSRPTGAKQTKGKQNFDSWLWQIDLTRPNQIKAQAADLNRPCFDLRGAEVFDVACDNRGRIFISFDATKGAANLSQQRLRGILRFQVGDADSDAKADAPWRRAVAGGPDLAVKILPDSGKTSDHHALGLTVMEMDGHHYLIGSIEETTNNEFQEIYAAEAETGRGLFKFNAPPMTGKMNTARRLAFGAGVLWVGEQRDGPDQVQRVVIKDNVYEPLVGYKRPRRIRVTITSRVKCREGENRGEIVHHFGHPLDTATQPNQGCYTEGRSLRMQSPRSDDGQPAGSEHLATYAPMNDPSSTGKVTSARYPASTTGHGLFKSVFEEDFWTREYRHFVYPHLTNNDLGILKETDFRLGHLRKGDPAIPDSLPRFHWTHQEQIFEDFIARVKAYIVQKYGVEADLSNAYWAARNVSEYLRDIYNYPAPPASEDGSGDSRGNVVDYDHFHVANGPAVYKMIMTDPRFKIGLRRRRSGCMAAGGVFLAVMRYMGYPARWIGTSIERPTEPDQAHGNGVFYDLNEDGMFNGDDYMNIIHGHYTNEVYLGPGYGWQRFDATPKKPDDRDGDGLDYEDFAYLHSSDSQYELMKRKITSGQNPKAVASSIGVGYNKYFFAHGAENTADSHERSIFHEATGVYTSACKGGQAYDFIFYHERPGKVRGRNGIRWIPSLTFDVEVNDGRPVPGKNTVEFTPRGPWAQFEPDARVDIVLRIDDGGTIGHEVLKEDIAWNQGKQVVTIPEHARGKPVHVQVRRRGPETYIGGASAKLRVD